MRSLCKEKKSINDICGQCKMAKKLKILLHKKRKLHCKREVMNLVIAHECLCTFRVAAQISLMSEFRPCDCHEAPGSNG